MATKKTISLKNTKIEIFNAYKDAIQQGSDNSESVLKKGACEDGKKIAGSITKLEKDVNNYLSKKRTAIANEEKRLKDDMINIWKML